MPEKIDSPAFLNRGYSLSSLLFGSCTLCIASPNILTKIPDDLKIENYFELHSNTVWQEHYQAYEVRLQQLDQQPQPLIEFMARLKSTRLGLRFEYLLLVLARG